MELSPGYDFSRKKKMQNMCSYDTECIKKSFAFGMVYGESGYLFFHPENHSVWEIYLDDLYVHPLADSFDEFLQNAKYLPNF